MGAEPSERTRRPATAVIAAVALLLAVGLMAWDHLWGNESGRADLFPVDFGTFLLTLALIVVCVAVVFGVIVPRAARHAEKAHRAALALSGAALLLAVPASWLGFPVILGAGGIDLGLRAMAGPRRRLAATAVGIGVLVLAFGILSTAFPASEAD